MKLHIATDHAGYWLKEKLVPYIKDLGFDVVDHGAYKLDPNDDYPDYISKAAAAVSDNPQNTLGIVIGGSGQGEAMVANKFRHVRATVYYGGDEKILSLSHEHNAANVLSLGARFLTESDAKHVVKLWLTEHFTLGDRHKKRIQKLEKIESDHFS